MRHVKNSGHLCPLIVRLPKTGLRKTEQELPSLDFNGRHSYYKTKKTLFGAFLILLMNHV